MASSAVFLGAAACSSTTDQDDVPPEVSDAAADAGLDATIGQMDAGTDATISAGDSAARDAASDDAGEQDASDGGPAALRHPYALTGLVGTGQSLSVGVEGLPLLSTTQPFHNVRLEDSTADPAYADAATTVPLVAPIRALNDGSQSIEYPTNIYGETPSESTANEISAISAALDGNDYPSASTVVGESGQALSVIQKNGTGNAYAQSIREAQVLSGLAAAAGKSFGYTAIFLTHGETDAANTMYEAGLVQLQSDYDTDLRAATGQTDPAPIPLFLSQQTSFPNSSTLTPISAQEAWQASVDHPTTIVCVGPKYQYEYFSDHIHMPAAGYVQLGEKYAEAYAEQVGRGNPWHPLQPLSVALNGTDLVVHLDVAHPPLSWDPTLTANHSTAHTAWRNGNGFEVSDSTGELTITAVAISGNDVHLTLAAAPSGTGLTVAYAMTQDIDNYAAGLLTGRHGALRDSDPFVGMDVQMLTVAATAGSNDVAALTVGEFNSRALHDRVSGGGLPDGITLTARNGDDDLILSSNWTGASGNVTLAFAHELRNYLVAFSMPVP